MDQSVNHIQHIQLHDDFQIHKYYLRSKLILRCEVLGLACINALVSVSSSEARGGRWEARVGGGGRASPPAARLTPPPLDVDLDDQKYDCCLSRTNLNIVDGL